MCMPRFLPVAILFVSASASTVPAQAAVTPLPAPCNDGSYSKAMHHRGACANHGGVAQWLKQVPN